MKALYKRIASIVFWGFLSIIGVYVGYVMHEGFEYHKEIVRQHVVMSDPDYHDWEDNGWEERIYNINDLTE